MICSSSDIPTPDLSRWREDPNLRPQQFSSSSLHPKLSDFLQQSGYSQEVPDSPMFPHIFDSDRDSDLHFVPKAGDDIQDFQNVLRQPDIGNYY